MEFERPTMEVIVFDVETDIVTASGCCADLGQYGLGWGFDD